jgi:aspartate kinase
MRSVVMKFGGSSVVDAPAITRVTTIVANERGRGAAPIVVVSALGGVTDELLALAESARKGDATSVEAGCDALAQRHLDEADRLGATKDVALAGSIGRHFDDLRAALGTIARRQRLEPAALDVVAATGELVSSRIVAAALAAGGLPAVWVDARAVVVTDNRHTSASPLLEETREAAGLAIRPLLAAGSIPVLGGFVGRTPGGDTTTLGRGGSDYSASLVGAAIDASEIQIWTDVDGMLTADPRLVADTEVVAHLSYAEAAELAYFGAKVLHPATIFPAVSRNIPVRILNSQRADAPGTLITARPAAAGGRPFAALAGKRGITVIDITSSRMLMAHGFLHRVFEAFENYTTAVDVVTTSEVSVSVTVDDRRRVPEIVAALQEIAEVSVENDMAILSIVGDALRTDPGLAARLIGAMADFPLRMVSQAASRRNLTVVLPEYCLAQAMTHLHSAFFPVPESSAR